MLQIRGAGSGNVNLTVGNTVEMLSVIDIRYESALIFSTVNTLPPRSFTGTGSYPITLYIVP